MKRNGTKNLLIVGAGAYQHYIYTMARSLGFKIFSVDADPVAPLFACADDCKVVDIYDVPAIAAYARENDVQAVATLNLDQGMNAVVAIQKALGLPAKDPDAVLAATRKDMMRTIWKQQGVSQPDFKVFDQSGAAVEWINAAGKPLIIKPVDNAAKRGIAKITATTPDISALVARAFDASKLGRIIVEEWIEGTLCFAPTYLRGGGDAPFVTLMKQRITERLVQIRYDAPFGFGAAIDTVVKEEAVRAARCFGEGPYHTEIIVTPEGKPYLVETSPRVSYATVSLSRLIDGFDPIHALLCDANGGELSAGPSWKQCAVACMQHLQPQPGSIYRRAGLPETLPPGIHEIVPVVPDGHVVQPFVTNEQRVMYFVAGGDDAQQLETVAATCERELTHCCFGGR